MGHYINPIDCSKEEWLKKYGTEVSSLILAPKDKVTVVLVKNSLFTAAGVMYSKAEFLDWQSSLPNDPRPMKFFHVPVSELNKLPGLEFVKYWEM